MEREGAGDGGREDTLEGTSGSAQRERERDPVTERREQRNDLTKNRVFVKLSRAINHSRETVRNSDLDAGCFAASRGEAA